MNPSNPTTAPSPDNLPTPPVVPPQPPAEPTELIDDLGADGKSGSISTTHENIRARLKRSRTAAEKAIREELIGKLGLDPETAAEKLKTLAQLEAAKAQAEDATKTAEQKANEEITRLKTQIETLTKQNADLLAAKNSRSVQDAIISEAEKATAKIPRNVVAWIREYRPEDFSRIINPKTGEIDTELVTTLTAACKAENKDWFLQTANPGSPPVRNAVGASPNSGDVASAEQILRSQVHF